MGNIVTNNGKSALHCAVYSNSIEGLKLLLSHPSLTALTLSTRERLYGDTPVMLAVRKNRLKHVEVLAADPRVDLDTTDKKGRSLEKVARDPKTRKVLAEAKQRGEEKVEQVDMEAAETGVKCSPISKLLGVRMEAVGEIIWQKLVENWKIFPGHLRPSIHCSAHHQAPRCRNSVG